MLRLSPDPPEVTAPAGPVPSGRDPEGARLRADRLVAAIDEALSRQVNRILHHPEFQAMEARWRGLATLVRAGGGAPDVKIKVLSLSWAELARSMERASEFDQSRLFDLVYSGEFGMPGGEPFGMLVGDYAIDHEVEPGCGDPVGVVSGIAGVAAAAFCPFVAGASPRLLGLASFRDLSRLPDMSSLPLDPALQRWRRLRRREDTRFVGLVAPRVLLRRPHRTPTRGRVDGFAFREEVGPDGESLLWGNGAFAFAAVAIRRFLSSGWFADLRGVPQDEEGGGVVTSIEPFDLGIEGHGLGEQPPVEIRLTATQEQQLSEFGLMPIATTYLSGNPVFNANQSLHEPEAYTSPQATQNARLAAMLQYVLCASRFAHYLKVMLRDEIGRLADARSIQTKLEAWLGRYTIGNDDADAGLRTRHPLRLAQVSVSELPGRPGTFACSVRLQPHFQLDDVATSFHLLTDAAAFGAPSRALATA